jgi:archaemetzincin
VSSRTLRLLPLGPPFPDAGLVEWLGPALERRLGLRVRSERERPLPPAAVSGPASADEVLDHLAELRPPIGDRPPADWTLALTAADLHAAGRAFVFGAAAVGGAWAVVSTARLLPDEPPPGPDLLRERLLKEALHELGHLAALSHCAASSCVMTASTGVHGVDRKGTDFCEACSRRLAALDPPLAAR